MEKKQLFEKKVSQCRKTERGPFGIFKHPMCCEISQKLKGGPFGEQKILEKKCHNAEKLKGGTLWGFSTSILSQNIKKLKEGKIFIFGKKIPQCRKKTEKGDPLGFYNIHSDAKQQKKLKGGPFGEKKFFRKKVSQCRKKFKGGPFLVSPGMACYGEKQEKPFWFSSLGQMVQ